MRELTITFDVSSLTDVQIQSLTFFVTAQSEGSDDNEDPEQNYPAVPIIGVELDAVPEPQPEPVPLDPPEPVTEEVSPAPASTEVTDGPPGD